MNLVEGTASKVPEVTLVFWIIKIAATTLGETGGDTVTMTLNWGYLLGTALFLSLLVIFVILQIAAKKFHPYLYWATIVASTTAGTTMADFADRSLGIGYAGGSSLLFVCLIVTLAVWYWTQGSVSVATVNTPKVEAFYWIAITFSQTLGTALGDWTADDTGLGYDGGAMVFAAGLAVLAALYFWTGLSRVFLFWAAFILTRPLGATVGDFLDKPRSDGGMAGGAPAGGRYAARSTSSGWPVPIRLPSLTKDDVIPDAGRLPAHGSAATVCAEKIGRFAVQASAHCGNNRKVWSPGGRGGLGGGPRDPGGSGADSAPQAPRFSWRSVTVRGRPAQFGPGGPAAAARNGARPAGPGAARRRCRALPPGPRWR